MAKRNEKLEETNDEVKMDETPNTGSEAPNDAGETPALNDAGETPNTGSECADEGFVSAQGDAGEVEKDTAAEKPNGFYDDRGGYVPEKLRTALEDKALSILQNIPDTGGEYNESQIKQVAAALEIYTRLKG